MRKYLRNQILEILSTISEGIEYAQKSTSNNAITVLNDCCEGIKVISDALKNNLSKQRFGAYDELLIDLENSFKAVINSISGSSVLLLTERIKKLLNEVETELKNDPEVKIEILFLPYKASMWDSLESIWLAAKDDPRCECFVMPIPYYDKNPDGSFGLFHYEGDQFPEYVPITHYEKYNISFCRPDIIFIHNPYDGNNYVTSVDPRFYSSELKKYTDMLVYVPYFVSVDDVQEHFCLLPGVFYSDKVIVQSEKVRQTYIRVFENFLREKQRELKNNTGKIDGYLWKEIKKMAESKFIALGSPKFDKVLNSKPEDFSIPQEWQSKIKNRKVVLYNTTISSLLNNKDTFVKKLRYVFDCFRKREDVVLWWRPHPLLESTIKSMVPEILDEYVQIVKEYREEGFGIFDDTADIHRAIAVSDAYYGDGGSLIAMYEVTGKPIMIQSMDIID